MFIQQFSGLIAYLETKNCTSILPFVYARMLISPKVEVFRPPGPLAAFGLSESIYQDAFVNDVSAKLTKSILFFICAHELGHIYHNHQMPRTIAESIDHEKQADAFAIGAAEAVGVFPYGMVIYLQIVSAADGPQNDHPMSSDRMLAIAQSVKATPDSFVDPKDDPSRLRTRIIGLTHEIEIVASQIDEFRQKLGQLAELNDWPTLKPSLEASMQNGRCVSTQHG